MARLLHIEASPRGPRSRSTMVAERLLSGLTGYEVERLALFDADLPRFEGATIEGRYALIAGGAIAPAVQADWAEIARLTKHFLSFDAWLFSTPMWNFGIPYRLKHYIDLITQPGLSFTVDAGEVIGHAAGKTAMLVGSGALDVRPGGPLAGLDFQIAYLDNWLRFLGVDDIHLLRVSPTHGEPEAVEAVMDAAYAEADALAAGLSRPARV